MSYADLGDDDQVEALRPAAVEAAARFGLQVARMELLLHAFNTTFVVDTVSGDRYALRVNTNSSSTPAEVIAQQGWQLAIAAQTPVLVPQPLLTPDGDWVVEVSCTGFGRPVLVTVASWLNGPDVVEPETVVSRELGRAMARLHLQAQSWQLPTGGAMPIFDTPLFGDEDFLDTAPGLSQDQRAVLDRAREVTGAAYRRVYGGAPLRALHADLHGGNIKWHEGRLAVFDFDDCGLGVPALDLAISTFYLRGGVPGSEEALREGYGEVAPIPHVDEADFEALVASRQLLLTNALLNSTTADLRSLVPTYLPLGVERLRQWLDTGWFTREVAGE